MCNDQIQLAPGPGPPGPARPHATAPELHSPRYSAGERRQEEEVKRSPPRLSAQKMPRRRECLSYARLYLSTISLSAPVPLVMQPRYVTYDTHTTHRISRARSNNAHG